MAQLVEKSIPVFVANLLEAIEQHIPGATTDVKRIEGLDHYSWRIGVLSDRFKGMDFDDRHDEVWRIARETLEPHRLDRITSIICLSPDELQGAD